MQESAPYPPPAPLGGSKATEKKNFLTKSALNNCDLRWNQNKQGKNFTGISVGIYDL